VKTASAFLGCVDVIPGLRRIFIPPSGQPQEEESRKNG